MHKHKQKIALLIAVVMILSVILGLFAPLLSASASSELDKAKQELAQLEKEKKEISAQISQIQQNQSQAYKEKQTLDKQIQNTNAQITTTEKLISALDSEISVEEKNLEIAEEKMTEQYETFKTRIRVMYEGGETTYLDILLASDNFFDMLSRYEISKQIMDYDKTLFGAYTENAQLVEKAKEALEQNKADQEKYKSQLASKKSSLESDAAKSEQLMQNLEADEQTAKAAYAEAQKAEEEMAKQVAKLAAASKGDYVGGDFLWPLSGYTRISSSFGPRIHPITGKNSNHTGIDLPAPKGVTIKSANAGKVIVSDFHSVYGNYVMVDHGGGMVTLYAHMSKRSVSAGATVTMGQKVGEVGTTGWSTGNHLHFEIIKNGVHQNPMNYFS